MPGWHGSALVTPYCEADLFSDYDIWSADVSLPDGNMLENCRWWQAAQDIAERLRQANAPAPRLIFGYSIAGSIAWLVGRLLAGTPQAPEFIVMIDAAPMHRLPHYGNKAISELANTIAAERLPAVIHIRRASLEQVGITTGSAQFWRPSDNIVRTLDVPTIAHLELGQASLLKLTAEWLNNALAHTPDSATAEPIEARIETPGGRLYRMIAAGDARRTTEFREMFDRLSDYTKHYSEALYLVLRDGNRDEAQQFIQHALLQHPGSRLLHYATRRIQRSPMALCPHKGIVGSFLSIQSVEYALSTHHTAPTTWKALNLLKQAVDIVGAVLCATPARLKLMIHRWADR
jgi:hypothetical protein